MRLDQHGSTVTTLSSLRSTTAWSNSLFPEEQGNFHACKRLTAPMDLVISVFSISSGVPFQYAMHMNGKSLLLIRLTSSHMFATFSPGSANPFVMYTMIKSTVATLSLTSCALQPNPERPPTSNFSILQAASATWFRAAMLVPPDFLRSNSQIAWLLQQYSGNQSALSMLLAPIWCSASATV